MATPESWQSQLTSQGWFSAEAPLCARLNGWSWRKPEANLANNNFDILRLIFASMVVVSHVGVLSKLSVYAPLEKCVSSLFAVQAFFVVSGILVTMSYEKSSSLASYAVKRLKRLAPAYVVVVVGAALLLSLRSELPLSEYFRHRDFWRYLGFNLLLSNFAAPDLPGVFVNLPETAINGSLWTIKIEVAFYCTVPFLVWACRKWGYKRVLPLVFFSSIAWKVGFGFLGEHGHPFFGKLARQLPGQLSFFAGGAWTYYWSREGRGFAFPYFLVGLAIYVFLGEDQRNAVAPAAATFIVGWAALRAPKLPEPHHGHDYSYGVYLYHFPIVQCFVESGLLSQRPWLGLIAVVGVVALVAIISWHFIERPFLGHRKKVVLSVPAPAAQ